MNSFYCYTPNPHKPKRPCFPKASAKVDTFTVNTKYYGHFFQAETPANLEKLPHINKEYAVKHIFNTRNHPRFKGKLFPKWKTKERKGAEKRGRKTRERRRKRRERRRGKEGIAPGRRGNETENTHKGNGKPKDGERKDRKDDKEEEVSGQKTHKESAGYVSGGVHKREIKGMGKGCKKRRRYRDKKNEYNWTEDAHKESMEDAMEQRNELERKNGGGGKDCKKEKTPEQRAHTGKTRKMHKKPHMKTSHIY